jgi:acyl-CoA synthetase (AMP-forming)/AMP-acid ligase II
MSQYRREHCLSMHRRPQDFATKSSGTPISGLLRARATETPDRAAFLEGSSARSVSWAQIAGRAEDLAAKLAGGGGGRRVGLAIDGAIQFCSTYLAGLSGGLCLAPLDPRATQAEICRQVEELGLTDLILDGPTAGLAGPMLGSGMGVWCLGELGPGRSGAVTNMRRAHPHRARPRHQADPAVILRTSGSTGRPKLIPLTQAQLLHGASQVVTHHRLNREDRGYCPLPLFHINAQVVGILGTLVSGGSLVVDRRLARDRFWETVDRSGATWLNLVPAILSAVSERPSSDPARIRFARSASSPLAEPVRRRFEETTGISVLETYGMTEAAGQITANPLEPAARRPGSVGLPAGASLGVDLRVVDEDGRELVAPGQVGTVQISGPSVISAYLGSNGAAQTTPARGPDGWLSTGDLAWRDPDGFVFLMGRTDDLINRGGEKLYPSEIEAVLLEDPRVAAASAVGRPHPSLGAEPVAFVVLRAGTTAGAGLVIEDLHRACLARLSYYKRPVEITITERLPVGATGKVQRSLVRDLAGATAK